ncbi:MAG: thiamine pyrophosphate-dependent dehydrogenase E1 component subunit alpha, partial [Verrucomicrobia bacterium]|nr:thiamine pyrophosphate-dependent dehydrogenase E1 component subunit alpha [Verrucomicrobiota bacterium]
MGPSKAISTAAKASAPCDALSQPGGADAEHFVSLLRTMLLSRFLDERIIRLYRQGAIQGGVYCGIGQEAIGAAATGASHPDDLFAPLIRNMSVHVGRGDTPRAIFQ